jgi:hypothetical protein
MYILIKMKRPVRDLKSGTYTVKNKEYKELFGSREQVWNGTAYKTPGGLTKSQLVMNKNHRIVSAVKFHTAKKERRLEKYGYFAKKGTFGYVKRKGTRKSSKKSTKKTIKGGDEEKIEGGHEEEPNPIDKGEDKGKDYTNTKGGKKNKNGKTRKGGNKEEDVEQKGGNNKEEDVEQNGGDEEEDQDQE